MGVHHNGQGITGKRHGPADLLVTQLCSQQACQSPALAIPAPQADQGGRRQDAVQDSRDSEIPCDLRIAEPQPAIDGGGGREDDHRPSARTEIPRKQCPQEKEARHVGSEMAAIAARSYLRRPVAAVPKGRGASRSPQTASSAAP
jgi:hypothetical protein